MTAAEKRRADRERKRLERAARRAAGLPEPASLDKLIVDALSKAVVIGLGHDECRPQEVVMAKFRLQDVLRYAREMFEERGLNRPACQAAMLARLVPLDDADAPPEQEPEDVEADDERADPEYDQAIQDLLADLCLEAPEPEPADA